MALPRFMYGDPSEIVDTLRKRQGRRSAQSKEARAQKAKEELIKLFEGDEMSKKDAELALIQWGEWAARPQFWEDLRAMPAARLYALSSMGREPNLRLDPQSQAMHKAFHQLRDDKVKDVLYLYYVVGLSYDKLSERTRDQLKLGRSTFYKRLDQGTIRVYNRGKAILEHVKNSLDK